MKPTRHPFRDIAKFYWIVAAGLGGFGVALNGCGLAIGAGLLWPIIPFSIATVGLLYWLGQTVDLYGRSAVELGRAADLIARGFLEDAETEHAKIPARLAQNRYVARRLAVQKGLIALARGDAARAEEAVRLAIEPRVVFVTEVSELHQKSEALAIRALARAALGKDDLAEADARAVDSARVTTPGALARAALARGVIHARRDDRSALERFIAQNGAFILEHASPRERMLVRSLYAIAHPDGAGVYREPAPAEESERDGTPDWIARFAPSAPRLGRAMFAESNDVDPPSVDAAAAQRVAALRLQAANALTQRRSRWRTLIVWVALVFAFLALWQFLAPRERPPPVIPVPPPPEAAPEPTSFTALIAATATAPVIMFAMIWLLHVVASRRERDNLAALRALVEGDEAGAEKTLRTAMKQRNTPLGLQARLLVVALENRRGNFTSALALTDEGIALATRGNMNLHYVRDAILPSLIVERAVALAAQGYTDDAQTELALALDANPWYAHAGAATFRVGLVAAARRGDLAKAAAIARTRTPDLAIDLETDLLADVILEASGARTTTERRRTQRELAELPRIAKWIDAVAPGIRTAERARVALPTEGKEEAEEEGAVEEEGWRKRAARVADET